jgi:hypothetical protein
MYRTHALQRMFERSVSTVDVKEVLALNDVIEDYPNDTPYPSRLLVGVVSGRPLHVVVAENTGEDEIIVITVYEPDPRQWDQEFRRRK